MDQVTADGHPNALAIIHHVEIWPFTGEGPAGVEHPEFAVLFNHVGRDAAHHLVEVTVLSAGIHGSSQVFPPHEIIAHHVFRGFLGTWIFPGTAHFAQGGKEVPATLVAHETVIF
ncbi:MAG: hypothetical protein NT154_01855 [Verrucomicrobia bacterium]|nr:hypothetical protein [Verrucomicrobiota bacterium]